MYMNKYCRYYYNTENFLSIHVGNKFMNAIFCVKFETTIFIVKYTHSEESAIKNVVKEKNRTQLYETFVYFNNRNIERSRLIICESPYTTRSIKSFID